MNNVIKVALLIIFFGLEMSAQDFGISAEIRPRFESQHGFKRLAVKGANTSNFISQRSRLNFKYKKDSIIQIGLSIQNVRVWGDVSTLAANDNAFALHEAWAMAILNDKISLKLGRQEIIYDDHRIFGNVGWAQQARSHDAFITKIIPAKNHKLEIGLALNADSGGETANIYSNIAGYKNFQYLWYHGDFNKLGLSVLLLNTGVEYELDTVQTIDYMQTIGGRLTYENGKFSANGAAYIQTGKKFNNEVSTSYFGANIGYKVTSSISLGVGVDYLSGKATNDTTSTLSSFAPLFGTNHKFNGWMDYFYVGNHGGSVGLIDINATLAYKKNKFSAKVVPHIFSSAADIYNIDNTKMDSGLGTEIDIVLGYKMSKSVMIKAGYSMMFATESLEILKGGSKDESNTWGWFMFVFKPELFTSKKK